MMATKTLLKSVMLLTALLIGSQIFAQKNKTTADYYTAKWKQVETFEEKQLPRSADSVTTLIHKKALAEKNTGEAAKSLVLMHSYRKQFTENNLPDVYPVLQSELKTAWEPYRQIVHHLTAQLLIDYMDENRWELYNRKTEGDSTKLETMSYGQISKEVKQHIDASLQNDKLLASININSLPQIIEKGTKPAHLRPTLWEVLAFKALEQLQNINNYDNEEIGEPFAIIAEHFSDPQTFVDLKLQTPKTNDITFECLLIWQKIIDFRLARPNEAEAHWNTYLERLIWLGNQYTGADKDSLLFDKMGIIEQKTKGTATSALAIYHKAMAYRAITEANGKADLVKTVDYLESGAKAWPKSEGGLLCKQLIEEIKQPSISLQTEAVYYPNKQALVNINIKNSPTAYYVTIPLHNTLYHIENNTSSKTIIALFQQTANLKITKLPLQQFTDYKNHTINAALPALSPGRYAILVSDKPKIQANDCVFAYSIIEVTSMSLTKYSVDYGTKLIISDRISGQPIEGVKVKPFVSTTWIGADLVNLDKDNKILISDNNGKVFLKENLRYIRLVVELQKGDDVCYVQAGSLNNVTWKDGQPSRSSLFIFTDRKIYRPGQTVYFKAVYMESDGKNAKALTNQTVDLALRDVNGNQIQKLTLTTNSFGSCSGLFQIPANVLTGDWAIVSSQGSNTFQVEAYKRPKFSVELTPPTNAYKAGDSLTVNGKVLAFSGNPLTNATVKFSVKKGWRYLPYYRSIQPSPQNEQEVALGTITTDTKGCFTIKFASKAPKDGQLYVTRYEITADATDLNGETQSTNLSVNIDIRDKQLTLVAPKQLNLPLPAAFKVTTSVTNFADQPVDGKGSYKVYQLTPNSIIKPTAYWDKPEVNLAPDSIAGQYHYPNSRWQYTEELLDSGVWDTQKSKNIDVISPKTLIGGKLKLVFWLDGDTTKMETVINISNSTDSPMPTADPLRVELMVDKKTPSAVRLKVGSALNNVMVHLEVMADGNSVTEKVITLNKTQQIIALPNGDYLGQTIKARAWAIHNNRSYVQSDEISIPDTTKALSITTETFREKLLPGAQETVKLKISGVGDNALPAELLAAMYDASLDKMVPNSWWMELFHTRYFSLPNQQQFGFAQEYGQSAFGYTYNNYSPNLIYPSVLLYWGYNIRNIIIGIDYDKGTDDVEEVATSAFMIAEEAPRFSGGQDKVLRKADETEGITKPSAAASNDTQIPPATVQVRRNLNETAFFYPHLTTDADGSVSFTYTVPESLTKWHLMALAHNAQGFSGQMERYAQTIKDLMIVPEVPRFFREDDEIVLAAKIVNLTDAALKATATIELLDAATQQPLNMLLEPANKTCDIATQNNAVVQWRIKVPHGIEAVVLRVKAIGNQHSDGEEHYIPVLPNRVMVSESLPILLNKPGKTVVHLKALEEAGNVEHHQLTLRYTQNAAWEVIKALPYLMEYPHECSEQLFSRLFGYAVGSHIVNTYPNIKQALELWERQMANGGKQLESPLEQNEAVKALLLQETPWQMAGENETANRKRLLKLLDQNYTDEQIRLAVAKLQELQLNGGSFAWFRGMGADDYMTRHLMIGFGQLKQMGSKLLDDNRVSQMVSSGVESLHRQVNEAWQRELKDTLHLSIGADELHLLHALSYFNNSPIDAQTAIARDSLLARVATYEPWHTVAEQAIAAMTFKRFGMEANAKEIMASLKEKAIGQGTDMVYYRGGSGWHWTDNAIETQALAIECFNTLLPSDPQIMAMQNYLVAQKRSQSWPTTRSTVMAVWGMMSYPGLFSQPDKADQLQVGSIKLGKTQEGKQQMAAGTFTKTWYQSEIKPSMGKVTINKQTVGQSWASLTWQYFTPIGDVKASSGATTITKALFVEKQTPQGTQLIAIGKTQPKIGDKVVVRLTINATQPMSYVHVKDMRSALLEPEEVFSQYMYQNGLGYYRAATDAAMNFFIGRLPKGTFTIEYALRIRGAGNTTNGFATLQCMYAPEFESLSESGVLVTKE
jgi:uncharacterized protein YfaS (alpha-2-macroglobulin family)